MLPSSRQVVDRATIARHILRFETVLTLTKLQLFFPHVLLYFLCFSSDQFDPFNREPLTMDMVIPQPQLRERIQVWLDDWKQKNVRVADVTPKTEAIEVDSDGDSP